MSRVATSTMSLPAQVPLESSVEKTSDTPADVQEQEQPVQDVAQSYSCFSPRQKTYISAIASFSAMFSGLSSFIYYPAITAISRSLHVSIELINLTITSYQIVSGIAPSILGDLADQSGRRPVCLIAFILYFSANLGLAIQNNYTALIVLRCLQSAGASSMYGYLRFFVAILNFDSRYNCHCLRVHCGHRSTSGTRFICRRSARLVSILETVMSAQAMY